MKKAIVLGARPGNIGGAIAERLIREHRWTVVEDDCLRYTVRPDGYEREVYLPPRVDVLEPYDACVITLGATHMEPFEQQTDLALSGVLYGSLELPLVCARRYAEARAAIVHRVVESTIVFIGSYAHNHPFTHCTSYCVAKAGLDMACKSLAWELGPKGFHVHIVHPHHVQGTPMTEQVRKGMMEGIHMMTADEAEAYMRKDLRMPDLLKPKEVAEVVGWLLTEPGAQWTSGTSIELYGGVR